MWKSAGLFRTRTDLEHAVAVMGAQYRIAALEFAKTDDQSASRWRRFNLLTVAWLIARAALRREESRGGHFRQDFPARDDLHWKVHLVEVRGRD
jgi:L-aspartate oxidase